MDFGTVGGFCLGWFFIIWFGIGPTRLMMFWDAPSVAITLGGTIAGVMMSFSLKFLGKTGSILKQAIFHKELDQISVIRQIVDFAEQARREGILVLEARAQEVKDEFLKKGIQLAVDGTEPDLIRTILSNEINFISERHGNNASIMGDTANLAPAFGMIGTLVGLVLMLANMSDPTAIGPAMAVALITTFYGAIVANLVCTPLESKLKRYSAEEITMKNMMLEGIMSLQSGDNPKIVQMKLETFLSPEQRLKLAKK